MSPSKINRRNFIANTARGTVVLSAGITAFTGLLESCSSSKKAMVPDMVKFTTGYNQTPLPYAYNALENVIDSQTMEIHYTKHAAAYSKALKEAVASEGIASNTSVEKILSGIASYTPKMRNNAGGHYNHEMFWKSMQPKTTDNKPTGSLLTSIEQTFTSFANFKSKFNVAATGRFGSGWAWLYSDGSKALKIGSTPNQDNPLMNVSDIKGFPLLGLDVWEHAYYLKYQNKRADYAENWWNIVNWNYVQSRFDAI